ncbi:hypothetical protein [Nonlabens sp.]|uniref:hypothetical protein n=1 Tax=Nonlabens sp. TaxID=1888209 RepID=UPI0032666687
MKALQKALKLNAIFSGTSGIVLILLHIQISKVFGTSNSTVFWIVGIALIYFALSIWYECIKVRKMAILWIIIQDYLWVMGSLILVVFDPFEISFLGHLLVLSIALIVLYMAINQHLELKKYTNYKL